MAKFIELTILNNNKPLSINIEHICCYRIDGDGDTCLSIINKDTVFVKESYEEVKKLLGVE